jgi:small-conductance mechanosensitive channel/CRP-like cAMP-binding protein
LTSLLSDPTVLWALGLILALPLLIIGIGELEERLRQRDSQLAAVVGIVRRWTIPLLAVWIVLANLLGLPSTNIALRLIASAVLVSLAAVALNLVRIGIAWWKDRPQEGRRGVPQLLLALPRVVLFIATGWILLDTIWGVDLSAALTALGVTSLVISFALQDTLSGLASGLLLLGDSPFQPGDWISAGDVEGRVVDINWRSSRIETRNGDLLVVPNAQLASGTIVNYDEPSRLHRVVVPVQVAYVNPPTRAKEMLLDAARATPHVRSTPAPGVRVVQIDDPLMGYEVDLWIDDFTLAPQVFSQFGSLVWYQSHRHDVPLPSPAYDVYMYDGVEAGEAGRMTKADIRKSLSGAPLMAELDEDDLDRLAGSAKLARFAVDEVIVDTGSDRRDLLVLWKGEARLVLAARDGSLINVMSLPAGEVFGFLGRAEGLSVDPSVRAVTDCEVFIIDEEAAGAVTSRNPALAAAFNRLVGSRTRRVERVAARLSQEAAEPKRGGDNPSIGAGSS